MVLNQTKILMIEELILNPNLKFTASQIARNKNINQKSTQIFLDSLENQGILKSHFQGKNKLFEWNNNNNLLVRQFILAIESLRTINFYTKNPMLKQAFEKILPLTKGIVLVFGSFADETQNSTSDIDVLCIGTYNVKEIQEIIQIYNLKISFKSMKKFEINPLTKEVIKKHILLKNSELYVNEVFKWTN